jgi:hypothetical protein
LLVIGAFSLALFYSGNAPAQLKAQPKVGDSHQANGDQVGQIFEALAKNQVVKHVEQQHIQNQSDQADRVELEQTL